MLIDTKQERTTRQMELVETNNISRSIKRMMKNRYYGRERWKRAIVHGMAIAGCYNSEVEAVRKAFQLP